MARRMQVIVEASANHAELTQAAAEYFVEHVAFAVETRGLARVAISGGSTPKAMFALLADPSRSYCKQVPWQHLQLFWVDERAVPPTDPESNYGMTKAAMLDRVPLPAANVHRIEGELDPEEAAARYEAEIRTAFRLEGAETPTFDLVLLGLGPDGHTASLFPHTEGLNEMARIVMANEVPQKHTWRLTLSWPVIVQGRDVAFLIEGEEKAAMVKTVFSGAYDPETYPAQMIRPANGKLTLLVDSAAAAQLPGVAPTGTTTLEMQ